MSNDFQQYRRTQIAEMRPYIKGETLSDRVSISASDAEAGSPKLGDMIARNPANHEDQWLVAADYFAANFEPLDPMRRGGPEHHKAAERYGLPWPVDEAADIGDRMREDHERRRNEAEHRRYCEAHGLPYTEPADQ